MLRPASILRPAPDNPTPVNDVLAGDILADATWSLAGADRLRRLMDAIRAIERKSPLPRPAALTHDNGSTNPWLLGEPALDDLIGPAGLDPGALHEIKPAEPRSAAADGADWMAVSAAARRFALALGVRRLLSCDAPRREVPVLESQVLWCASAVDAAELGRPSGAGLAALGLDPRRLIVVEPAKAADVLWTLEEGLKAGALALVLGQLPAIDLTPARRLALAAAGSRTPCLLLTHPRAPVAPATSTRWRIAPAPSAANRRDGRAPGAARFLISLERCRGRPAASQSVPFVVEWCDAALRFRLAADVAVGAPRKGEPWRRQSESAWSDRAVRRIAVRCA